MAAGVSVEVDYRQTDCSYACRSDKHPECDGELRAKTGHHWFCACTCHPVPTRWSTAASQKDLAIALDTFRVAREHLAAADRRVTGETR